ncbi:MAG: response regulator transcription factor [Nevskiaceae bacterium]|nr:MAG: response regulator transcription factor [Nevskiaceae bacterium]TBR71345.1 MAG: response regulator transcription factor [Nevskiaceae bacterium]
MRVAIVDDEPLARERLAALLAEFPGYELVGEAVDGESALRMIEKSEPDVVLLDIRMGGAINGLQVARTLAEDEMPPAVIFITAYPEHALSAFDAKAAAYLLKPVRRQKLQEALQQVRRISRAQIPALDAGPDDRPKREFITATTRDGVVRVRSEDIIYFMADQKYTTVCHLHGEVLIEESLRTLEKDFASWFLRVHRKVLVATRFIAALERGRGDDDSQHWLRVRHATARLPVSRRRLSDVRRFLVDDSGAGGSAE